MWENDWAKLMVYVTKGNIFKDLPNLFVMAYDILIIILSSYNHQSSGQAEA